MHRWEELMESCLKEDEAKGLSGETIDTRRRELTRCGQWLRRRRPKPVLDVLDGQMLISYIRWRSMFKAKSTVAGTISILKRMGEYLVVRGLWRKNPMRWIRGPKIDIRARLPRRIRGSDLVSIWKAAEGITSNRRRMKWRAVFALLYATGLRRAQLAALDVDDLDLMGGRIRIKGIKGGRDHMVPIAQEVCDCLSSYMVERKKILAGKGLEEPKALFVTPDGRRQTGPCMSVGVKRIVNSAGLERITMHQFRHTCASDLLARGVHLPEVQHILGHTSIGSTMWYLSVSDESRKEAIAKHPINDILEDNA